MTAFNVVSRAAMAAGQPEDISVVLANLDAIAAVLNGNLDNSNVNAAAAIAASKLAGYPADLTKVLRGDGAWAVPSVTTIFDVVVGRGQAGDPASPGLVDSNTILGGNIPQTYKHLRLEVVARTDFATTLDFLGARLNNDTAGNYDCQRGRTQAAVANASESFGLTALTCGLTLGTTAAAGLFGATIIDIPNYADTTMNKTVISVASAKYGVASGNLAVETAGSYWRSSAAITRIGFIPYSGGTGFVTGSRFTLYGIN